MAKSINAKDIKSIIFACEAGIGSSLMSVNALKKKMAAAKLTGIEVFHKAVTNLPVDAKLIVCHDQIKKSVKARAPEAVVVSFKFFFNDPLFDQLIVWIKEGKDIVEN